MIAQVVLNASNYVLLKQDFVVLLECSSRRKKIAVDVMSTIGAGT